MKDESEELDLEAKLAMITSYLFNVDSELRATTVNMYKAGYYLSTAMWELDRLRVSERERSKEIVVK